MSRIVFRADGSGETGYGHFIRSLALASYLREAFDCHFTTYNSVEHSPTEYQLGEIAKVCEYFPITGSSIEEANSDFLNKLKPGDIVVLDNYYYTTAYQQTIKNIGCKLVCIDDMHDRHMVCNLVMTASPLKREDFSLEFYTRFIGGIEWAFLRDPFLTPTKVHGIKSGINRVVMAMGGADPFNLTDKMIRITHKALPETIIEVIAGDTVEIPEKIADLAIIHRRLEAEKIVELFDNSDLGIFPASTVCMEAFSRRLPVVAGYYVDNQEEFYRYGVKNGLFSGLGCLLDEESLIEERLKNIINNHRLTIAPIDFHNQKRKIIQVFKELEIEKK